MSSACWRVTPYFVARWSTVGSDRVLAEGSSWKARWTMVTSSLFSNCSSARCSRFLPMKHHGHTRSAQTSIRMCLVNQGGGKVGCGVQCGGITVDQPEAGGNG